MTLSKIDAFHVIGISVKTTNENGQSAQDIGELWGRLMGENISAKISNKASENIYCIYTDYEGDYTKPYTTLLGYKVSNLESIPEGMTGMSFSGGDYKKYHCEGSMAEGVVYKEWNKIWNENLDRAYTADIEVYQASSNDPNEIKMDILVALNS